MEKRDVRNLPPIFSFLYKHKWRIILPLLFALFYFALPRYLADSTAVQQYLFIKSAALSQNDLKAEARSTIDLVRSDEFLENLVAGYDLYRTKKLDGDDEYLLIEKLRKSIYIQLEEEELVEGVEVSVWIHFRDKENAQHIAAISNDITAQFEKNKKLHVDKYVSKPYEPNPYRNWVFFGGILQGLIMISLPLILLWELPNLFYSPKTKEMVFEPLKADWHEELLEAKLRNKTWTAFQINVRYSYAYLATIWQKSPIGDLIEFFSKLAK